MEGVRSEMVRAWIESLLEEITGDSNKIVPDEDGDYPIRYRDALYYVRLVGEFAPVVQVFAVAVEGIEASAELFEALNDLNRDIRFARTFWVRSQVLIEADLFGQTLSRHDFQEACRAVATITDRVCDDLAARFGGQTAFSDSQDDQGSEIAAPTGLYL